MSDNRYPGNTRSAGDFLAEIVAQAGLAEALGFHSVWIGEHHFNRRGSIPTPVIVLAHVAAATRRVRLGPAVVVLPVHHPLHVAEEWATLDQLSGGRVDFACGRGYDAHEYEPFGADFQASAEVFAEAVEVLDRLWSSAAPVSFAGKHYRLDAVELCPKPHQRPFRPYIGSFSRYSMEIAARFGWNLLLAPFAANLVFGGLEHAIAAYREIAAAAGRAPGRIKASYFIHIGAGAADVAYGCERLVDYFTLSGLRRKETMGATLPPTMAYYAKIGAALTNLETASLDDTSILIGGPERIIRRLAAVRAMGVEEVLLYFNYGNKPDAMVQAQMERFAREIAPAFRAD